MSDIADVSWVITHEPQQVIGRIGYPGDRTVRLARGVIEFEVSVTTWEGERYEYTGREAILVALILRPWETEQ